MAGPGGTSGASPCGAARLMSIVYMYDIVIVL